MLLIFIQSNQTKVKPGSQSEYETKACNLCEPTPRDAVDNFWLVAKNMFALISFAH